MEYVRATSLDDALSARAAVSRTWPLAGGTQVMLDLRAGRPRPDALLDVSRVPELVELGRGRHEIRIGAAVTYANVVDSLSDRSPAVAMASSVVGSPQIRHRATVGGCLGVMSPDGDLHAALIASKAVIEIASTGGTRRVAASEFYGAGPGMAITDSELITAVVIPRATGPQVYFRLGRRAALTTALASFALVMDVVTRSFSTGLSAAPMTPRRAEDADAFLSAELAASGDRRELDQQIIREFGTLVSRAANTGDTYLRSVLGIMARRGLQYVWSKYRESRYED